MKLLTKELEKRFATIGGQSDVADPIVIAKFFNPTGQGTWFATEYYPADRAFYGYVSLFNEVGMNEFGSFSLAELEGYKGRFGLGIERHKFFSEIPLSLAKEKNNII
jgi:hypothetical protein